MDKDLEKEKTNNDETHEKDNDSFLDNFQKTVNQSKDKHEDSVTDPIDRVLDKEDATHLEQFQNNMRNEKRWKKSKHGVEENNNKKYDEHIKELEEQIKKLLDEIEHERKLKAADIANLTKKRIEQEHHIRKYGVSNLAADLIRPFELLKGVVNTPSNIPEVQNYLIGFNMIVNQMQAAFEASGIKPMNVKVGQDFDSYQHDANESVDAPEFSPHKIVQVISDGYMIHDRVLVHAIVKVSK